MIRAYGSRVCAETKCGSTVSKKKRQSRVRVVNNLFFNKPFERCSSCQGDAGSPKVRRASTNTLYYRRRRGPVSKPVPGLSRSRRLVTFEALSECCHAVTMQYRAAPSFSAHEFVLSCPVYFQRRRDRFSCRRRGGYAG